MIVLLIENGLDKNFRRSDVQTNAMKIMVVVSSVYAMDTRSRNPSTITLKTRWPSQKIQYFPLLSVNYLIMIQIHLIINTKPNFIIDSSSPTSVFCNPHIPQPSYSPVLLFSILHILQLWISSTILPIPSFRSSFTFLRSRCHSPSLPSSTDSVAPPMSLSDLASVNKN